MLDFNDTKTVSDKITSLIDKALTDSQKEQTPRHYLGGSRLGVNCSRALQYEYLNTPMDEPFSGKLLRIFALGHIFEELAIDWIRNAGFDLITEKADGHQFGFSVAQGRIKGHIDGVIINAPAGLGLSFPMLWECKSLNHKSWTHLSKYGLAKSKPVYAAQVATYQAYMEGSIRGICNNPALFTAINKDTAEFYFELVPFDRALAQKLSDRAVNILRASEAGETLPPISLDPDYFECRFCNYTKRCHGDVG